MRKKFLLMFLVLSLFSSMGGGHLFAQNLLVNCDYNSSTEGYGTTKFSNYAGAYAYATANATTATIVIEKTNTLSGNTFDNNHKNYSKLAVVIKDGATMGNALSKWDMTYPVTVEPGGTLTCARPISASVSNIHIKNKLIVGAKGNNSKKAYVDFLSDTYQDCDISIRYNGSIEVYNADFKIQDLDAQGKLTIEDSKVEVDGAFASATFYATTLTNTEMVVNGNQISGGLSDFAGGTSNQLGNVKINNSTLTIKEGTTKVAANVTATNSTIAVNDLTINNGKTLNLNEGSTLEAENITTEGTGSVKIDGVQFPVVNGAIVFPQGNNFTGYTRTDAIWGEVWGNASNSFVIKVLDENGNVMGTTSLNNIGGIIDGDVTVTWNLKLDAESNTDEYWTMSWTTTTAPTIDNMPAKVELWVDGVKVSGGDVVLNGPDNLDVIYAAVTDADGKILSYHTSIANAVAAITNTRSNPQGYIALLRHTDETVTLPAGITLNLNGFTAANVSVPVASVNGTSYTDIQEAIKAAAPSGTVEILSDVTVDKWIMFSETLNIGSGQIITMSINGLTINGNNKAITIKSIESASNGNRLFYDAKNLNIKDLTINCKDAAANQGGIGLTSGTIENVTFNGGAGVFPGTGNITIQDCTFKTNAHCIYYEEARNNLVVTGNTFELADNANVILLRGNTTFTDNIVKSGRTVNVVSGSPEVTGNNFNGVRFKVYNAATATISGNTINNLVFNDNSVVFSTFGENTLSTEAQDVLDAASFPVAQIGTTKYGTLQAAINAVQNGETITLLSDITENVTLTEKVGLYYTIDGSDKTMNGSITVNPLSDTNDNRRITISNINFVENTDTDVNFISAVKTNHYPRLTISDCDFTGSGNDGDVAIRLKSSHSVVINNCTGTKLHSFLQNTSGWNLTINNVAVTESKGGLALGTVQGVTVKGSNIDVNGYGIRLDANTYNNNAVIETCTVNAFIPVVVRNVNTESSITFNGTNTMTQTNTDGLWCAIGTTEYEENGTMPTAPTGDVTVTLNGTGLSMDGVYGNYYEFSGEGTAENPYLINNLYELKYFRDDVNGGNNYAGKYIQLNADIDLAGENWVGIGTATTDHGFMGNFDGKTYKIKNLTITNPALDSDNYAYAGLFGVTEGTETAQNTIKNLTIENVTISTTGHIVSAAIAYPYYTIVDNVKVCGNINITGGDYTAGALAYTRRCVDASNITVEGGENSIIKGEKTVGGVISDIQMNGGLTANYSNFSASNVTVEGDMSVGGISGIIAGQTLNTCSVMNVTLVCSDNRVGIVSGSLGAPSTITNVTVDNVTGATNIIGATYDGGKAVEAKIGDTYYASLQAALNAAAAGTGNVTVEILEDINLTGIDWNPVTVSDPGYPSVTVNGNNKTITGLNDMLFAGTWAGNSGLIINDLTIANSTIVNDKDDAKGTVGVGAFIGFPQASATITLNDCHLVNSTVEGGHWTGGLIGYAAGYAGNDGPVFMNLTIKDCSVTESTITGKGSVGGIIGHGSGNAWTNVVIEETTVSNNTITSTGTSTNKAGAIMGTIGAAGQPTTVNGVTHTGGATVSATVADNTVTSGGTTITTIYGRQGTPTGMLELAGGSYDKYPIEEGVAYAAPAEGFKIEENEDGTYGVVVDPAYGKVAKIGDVYYETLADAYTAATDGQTITLLNNITLSEKFVIAKSITLDGNNKTLTYIGEDRAIDVPYNAEATINTTIKNLEIVAETANRGINYNENGEFNVEGVTVTIGENVDGYAINFPGMADDAQVTIKDSKLTSRNPLNIWGENMTINVYDSEIISVDNSTTYDYAAIQLNNDNYGNVANGTVVNVYGGKITALNDNDEPSNVVANATETGVVNISDETIVTGKVLNYVANIGGVYFGSLQAAVNAIEKYGYNSPIVIMKSFATSETATVKNGLNVTIDLNGKTITVTDETEKNFEAIKNQGTLTIKDSSADKTGKITVTATTNSGWNRYSAVIANTVGGKLTIDGGTLEHLGGTDMAYGIDNLTNGKGTYAETVINGGTIKSTYRGIRQFLNGTEAQNILTVNGGTIEGANKSIWMQDPNKNANTGTLTVGENATLEGDVYLYVTEGSTEWPVAVSIADGALAEGSEVMTANVPAGYELQQDTDGNYVVNQGVAKIGYVLYATVTEAINAADDGATIQLLPLTIDEYVAPWATDTQHTSEKSITIIGAENFGTTMTGGLYLGYDNSQCREHTIVVKGINFTGKGILVASQQNVIVEGNKFTDITDYVASSGSADKNAISIIGKDVIATVKNNVITTTASVGIDLRNILTATVDGNTVTGTQHNSMQIQNASANSSAEIANNRFFDWGKSGEGRAMRINQIVTADVNNNVMINVNAPEEFVKITGHTTAKIDENYWNGANPTSSNTPAYFLAEGVQVHNYYAVYDEESNTLRDLVTIEGAGETFEKFYTAAGVETTSDNAAYSLSFTVTDYANNEVSVKIGSKKPAQNSSINLVTPSEVQFEDLTFNVTSVANNGFNGTRFKTITISNGVRTLGTKALANMYDLTSVVFPSTLVSVGDNCFHGYGDSHKIKSITSYAVEAPAASGNWQTVPFQQCIADVAVLIVPNAVSYEEYATAPGWSRFYEEPNGGLINHIIGIGTELEIAGKDNKYTMIATITSMNPMECSIKIGQKPASNSNAELVIPTSVDFVESIEGFDFTVTSIPNNAFSTCYNFTGNLEIPATVKTIGNSAFLQAYYNTLNVGKLTLNEGLETILNSAFTLSYFNNENLVIPTTVTTIGSHAFNATNMSGTLTVKNNIPGGFNGFAGSLFTMVVVEEGVTSIVDSSSKGVFSNMSKLETVILPSTLEEIGVAAFSKDPAITTITINAAVPPTVQNANVFEQEVFANATLFVPDHAAKALYKEAYVWKEFANISTPIITQTTQLNAGWNWFSAYVETDLKELQDALGENGVQISSQTGFSTNFNGNWMGSLTTVSSTNMYNIYSNAETNVEISGELIDYNSVEITLHNKWNWISYPMNQNMSINYALNELTPSNFDQISSQEAFATYFEGTGWVGSLLTLESGKGYKYYSQDGTEKSFTYTYTSTRGETKANITAENNHWVPNASQYANNMTMTAMVDVEGGDYEVAAFVDGEVRGSARPIYVEALDSYMLFLTIHGEGVEEMTFKFYDLATGEEYALNDRMNYSDDAIVGSLKEPYMFNRGTTGIGEASLSDINIYPNPTTTGKEINLQATCDKVEVFNALGVKVAEYQNVDSIDAIETAGIYVIRITNGGNVKHCSLVVK